MGYSAPTLAKDLGRCRRNSFPARTGDRVRRPSLNHDVRGRLSALQCRDVRVVSSSKDRGEPRLRVARRLSARLHVLWDDGGSDNTASSTVLELVVGLKGLGGILTVFSGPRMDCVLLDLSWCCAAPTKRAVGANCDRVRETDAGERSMSSWKHATGYSLCSSELNGSPRGMAVAARSESKVEGGCSF